MAHASGLGDVDAAGTGDTGNHSDRLRFITATPHSQPKQAGRHQKQVEIILAFGGNNSLNNIGIPIRYRICAFIDDCECNQWQYRMQYRLYLQLTVAASVCRGMRRSEPHTTKDLDTDTRLKAPG